LADRARRKEKALSVNAGDVGEPLDCVAFILCDGTSVLAEKRRADKRVAPGVVALPGGHVDDGETLEAALTRELMEELGVVAERPRFVCTLLYQSEELRRLHYYAIEAWSGEIENNEAESLQWVPLDDLSRLDLDVDREAMALYLRDRKR